VRSKTRCLVPNLTNKKPIFSNETPLAYTHVIELFGSVLDNVSNRGKL